MAKLFRLSHDKPHFVTNKIQLIFKLNSSPRDVSCFLSLAILFIMASKGAKTSPLTPADPPESFSMTIWILGHDYHYPIYLILFNNQSEISSPSFLIIRQDSQISWM